MKRNHNRFFGALQAFGLAAALFCSLLTPPVAPAPSVYAEVNTGGREQPVIEYVTGEDLGPSAEEYARKASVRTYKAVIAERDLWNACSGGRYWRSRMTSEEQAFYDSLYGTLMMVLCGSEDLEYDGKDAYTPAVYTALTGEEAENIAYQFLYNEPEFFFISNGFSLSATMHGHTTIHGVSFHCYPEFASGAARRQAADVVLEKILYYREKADAVHGKLEKARAVFDSLAAEMRYENSHYDQSVYAALLEGRGVCAAYSEAYAAILNAAGVETVCITSRGHEWNQVCLDDGNWYAVDLTWADQGWGVDDNFFCITDEMLLEYDRLAGVSGSHVPEDFWAVFHRPPCLHTLDDYFRHTHTHTWDGGRVTAAATAQAEGRIVFTCVDCGETIPGTLPRIGSFIGMHRLYYPGTHEHFYTGDDYEFRVLITTAGWIDEGIGWYAPKTGDPVYRLYNPYSTDHHYTMDAYEYMTLGNIGWNQEGVGWYSDRNRAVPVYRQFAKSLITGTHNYTTDAYERAVNAASGAWEDEGIGWYGLNP